MQGGSRGVRVTVAAFADSAARLGVIWSAAPVLGNAKREATGQRRAVLEVHLCLAYQPEIDGLDGPLQRPPHEARAWRRREDLPGVDLRGGLACRGLTWQVEYRAAPR